MLKFLQRLFGRKGVEISAGREQELVLSLQDFENWLSWKENHSLSQFSALLSDESFNKSIEKFKSKIESLKKARLMNEKIPERAKHFAEGNRQALIRAAEQLVSRLSFPEISNIKNADATACIDTCNSFFADFNEKMSIFAKLSARPCQILVEFFYNETRELMQEAGHMERIVAELKQGISRLLIDKISELKYELKKLKHLESEAVELQKQSSAAEKEIAMLNENESKLRGRLLEAEQKLSGSAESKRLASVKKEIEDVEGRLRAKFFALERPFRKLARLNPELEKTIKEYLADPVAAISHDFSLKIIQCLERLKESIESGLLDLKEKAEEKVILTINSLTRENINLLVSRYALLRKEEESLLHALSSSDEFKRTKMLKNELAETADQLKAARMRFADVSVKIERLARKELLSRICLVASEVEGRKVVLNIHPKC